MLHLEKVWGDLRRLDLDFTDEADLINLFSHFNKFFDGHHLHDRHEFMQQSGISSIVCEEHRPQARLARFFSQRIQYNHVIRSHCDRSKDFPNFNFRQKPTTCMTTFDRTRLRFQHFHACQRRSQAFLLDRNCPAGKVHL